MNFRKICSWVLLYALVGTYAQAALPPTTTRGQLDTKSTTFNFEAPSYQITKTTAITGLIETGNYNLLKNPSFEGTTFSDGWTKTGSGTFVLGTSANVAFGLKSFVWTPVGGAETIVSTLTPVPEGLKGKSGELTCSFRVGTGINSADFSLYNGTTDLATTTLQTVGSTFTTRSVYFLFPSTGSVGARLTSNPSNIDPIAGDDCYLGPARNISIGSVDTPAVSFTPTGSWVSNTTYTGKWWRVGDRYHFRVRASLTGAPTATSLTMSYLIAGLSVDTTKMLGTATNGSVPFAKCSLLSGGGVYEGEAYYNGTTLAPTALNSASTYAVISNVTATVPNTFTSGDSVECTSIDGIPVAGWQASTVVGADQQRTPVITTYGVGSTTYVTPAGATYLKVRMIGAGGGGAGSGTSGQGAGTNAAATTFGTSLLTAGGGFGGTLQSGGALVGGVGGTATINAPAVGISFNGSGGNAGQYIGTTNAYLVGGQGGVGAFGGAAQTSNAGAGGAATAAGSGGAGAGASSSSAYTGSGGGAGSYIDAMITNPATSYAVFVPAAGAGGAAGTSGSAGGNAGAGFIEVTAYFGATTALLANSVSTDVANGEKVVRAGVDTICSSSPCTLVRSSGITSITRASTGNYTATFSTPFSSTPECYGNGSSSVSTVLLFSAATTTSVGFQSFAGAAITDNGFRIWCMGPR